MCSAGVRGRRALPRRYAAPADAHDEQDLHQHEIAQTQFVQAARQVVAKTLEASNKEEKTDWGVIKEKIRADLKRYIVKETSRRPLIMPVILEL